MSAEPQQEALDFGRLYRISEGARRVYRLLGDAVDQTGVLPAAGACGIDRGDLRRALDREGRKVAVEHAMAIAAIVDSIDLRRNIATAIVQPLGFRLIDDAPLDDHEARIRLESALRSLGPIGEAKMAEAYGGRR
jgi:hypothetical protein